MEWFCTTSFRSDVFQMGLLSALQQFLCNPPHPTLHTHTHAQTHTYHRLFHPFIPMLSRKRKKKGEKEELMSMAELKATSAVSDSKFLISLMILASIVNLIACKSKSC